MTKEDGTLREDRSSASIPRVLLQAGRETCEILDSAIRRCFDGLAGADVLEVVSQAPGVQADIPGWCRLRQHGLLGVLETRDAVRSWIRKQR